MQKKKVWNIICILVWAVQFIVEAVTLYTVFNLNMVPDKYMAVLTAILVVLWLIPGVIMLLHGKNGKYQANKDEGPGVFRRVLGIAFSVLVIVLCIVISVVLSDVYNTMSNITEPPAADGVTMAVYVLEQDPAQTIQDAADYTFAVVDGYETYRTEKFLEIIHDEVGKDVELVHFTTITDMVDALYVQEVNCIILNSAYVQLLEDNELYGDFSETTRILFSAMIPDEVQETVPAETEDQGGEEFVFDITKDPFIVYVSGSDTRSTYLTTSRSDVNILMVVNPQTKQVLLMNTPRDYYVPNPSGGGAKDKLTHCGIYGINCSMEALAGLYDTSVKYYAQINFTGFETLIDAIGGIEVYSNTSFNAGIYSFQKGMNYMDGAEALAFARDRKHQAGGDNDRGKNQMKVITAVLKKMTSGSTIISNYSGIMESMQGMFKTNLTADEIGSLVKMQLDDMASWNIMSYAVSGTGGSNVTYSMPGVYVYVMYPNEKLVDYGAELIDRVFAGEILTEEDMTCPD